MSGCDRNNAVISLHEQLQKESGHNPYRAMTFVSCTSTSKCKQSYSSKGTVSNHLFGSHTIRWNKLRLLKVSLQFSAYESTFQFTTNPCSIFIPQNTIAAQRRVDMHIKRSPADIITPLIKLCSSRCRMFCSSVRLGLSIQNILRLE